MVWNNVIDGKTNNYATIFAVLDGTLSPTVLLKNATYLNQTFRKWMTANIWIYNDRIVYVGENLPENTKQCEIVDCTGMKLVPGYIEPHAHPFQLYNPHSFVSLCIADGDDDTDQRQYGTGSAVRKKESVFFY